MHDKELAMLAAIKAGRDWRRGNTSVKLGAMLGTLTDFRGQQREVRVNGLLIATLGTRGFIMVRDPNDSAAISRLNVILQELYGETYSIKRLRSGKVYVTHPGQGFRRRVTTTGTYLAIGEWWEVPGTLKMDPMITHGYDNRIFADER